MKDRLIEWVLCAVIGAILFYVVEPNDPVTYTEVIVPAPRIIEREPPARPPTIIERVRYVNIQPNQVATAIGGALGNAQEFCRPTTVVTTDTLSKPVDPTLLLRSVVHTSGWFWQKDNLFLSGPTSYGDLTAADYSVRPGFSARVSGDSALVRYPRTAFFKDLLEVFVPLALGFVIGQATR